MSKMTIEEFVRDVARQSGGSTDPTVYDLSQKTHHALLKLETQPSSVASILTIAKIAENFEDFPEYVPLGASKGHFSGVALKRTSQTDGVWRLDGSLAAILPSHSVGGATLSLSNVTTALNIPDSPVAIARLREMAVWATSAREFALQVNSIVHRIPPHVIAALVSRADYIVRDLTGGRLDPATVMADLCDLAKENGADLASPLFPGGPTPLVCLAAPLYGMPVPCLEIFLSARRSHLAQEDLNNAMFAAASRRNLSAVLLLNDAGANAGSLDLIEKTVLHVLSEGFGTFDRDEFADAVVSLAEAGADIDVVDMHGVTVREILKGQGAEDEWVDSLARRMQGTTAGLGRR